MSAKIRENLLFARSGNCRNFESCQGNSINQANTREMLGTSFHWFAATLSLSIVNNVMMLSDFILAQ